MSGNELKDRRPGNQADTNVEIPLIAGRQFDSRRDRVFLGNNGGKIDSSPSLGTQQRLFVDPPNPLQGIAFRIHQWQDIKFTAQSRQSRRNRFGFDRHHAGRFDDVLRIGGDNIRRLATGERPASVPMKQTMTIAEPVRDCPPVNTHMNVSGVDSQHDPGPCLPLKNCSPVSCAVIVFAATIHKQPADSRAKTIQRDGTLAPVDHESQHQSFGALNPAHHVLQLIVLWQLHGQIDSAATLADQGGFRLLPFSHHNITFQIDQFQQIHRRADRFSHQFRFFPQERTGLGDFRRRGPRRRDINLGRNGVGDNDICRVGDFRWWFIGTTAEQKDRQQQARNSDTATNHQRLLRESRWAAAFGIPLPRFGTRSFVRERRRQVGEFFLRWCRCQLLPEFFVVGGLCGLFEQTQPGNGQFIQDLGRIGSVLARLVLPHEAHLFVGSPFDHVQIVLVQLNAQQSVMIWRLVLGQNSQPFAVWIKHEHTVESKLEGMAIKDRSRTPYSTITKTSTIHPQELGFGLICCVLHLTLTAADYSRSLLMDAGQSFINTCMHFGAERDENG